MNRRLLILAALALGVWVAASLWPGPEEKGGKQDSLWPAVNPGAVDSVSQHAQQSAFALEKQEAGDWLLTVQKKGQEQGPLRAAASKVEALMRYIEGHGPMRRLDALAPDGDRLAQFGLDKPQTMLTLLADREWRIALGDTNPSGDGVYALSSLEPGILLLEAGYQEQFTRAAKHYYDLRLLDMETQNVERIRAQGPVTWEMTRREEGEGWDFTWPEALTAFPVATYEANMFAHDLASLQGQDYLLDWSEPAAEQAVELTFSIWRKGADEPQTVRIFADPGVVDNASLDASQQGANASATAYVASSSWQTAPVSLDATAWGKLSKTAFSLREREVLSLDQGALGRMELVPADKDRYKPLEAVMGEKLWEDPQGEKLLGLDVLLWRLGDLKYEGPERQELPQTAKLQLTWKLFDKDGDPVAVVRFHDDPELPAAQCWVGLDDPEKYYPVDRELLDDLRSRLAAAPQQSGAGQNGAQNATAKE